MEEEVVAKEVVAVVLVDDIADIALMGVVVVGKELKAVLMTVDEKPSVKAAKGVAAGLLAAEKVVGPVERKVVVEVAKLVVTIQASVVP